MRRIIAAKDPVADLDSDKEYTDWTALEAIIDEFCDKVRNRQPAPLNR